MYRKPLLLLGLVAATLPAVANEDGVSRCRAIAEAAARLACYDALPLVASPATPAAPAARAAPVPPARPAPREGAANPQASAPALESSFGLEGRAAPAELPSVESHIPGSFDGWSQGSVIRLANGQAWQVMDEGSRRMRLQDPRVRVRRGAMGAFYLEFEAHNHSPRVRRLQ
jgi:hypothetical protein